MIVTIKSKPKSKREARKPGPAITQHIVTIKSAKTLAAEERHLRLIESGPTIPRNYGPKG